MLSGEITIVLRRWRTQRVYADRTYRTNVGRLAVDQVTELDPATITARDAHRAGKADADEVRTAMRGQPDWPVFRIAFHLAEDPDPRDELAARADPDEPELADVQARLARLDRASTHGPWTRTTLAIIAAQPATRAADLAAVLGRETVPFKLDVRKLKNLGLTYSLDVGYRLAPRGAAYLRWLS